MEDELHEHASSAVLSAWEMPTIVCEAVRYIRTPDQAPNAREQASIVNGADAFANFMLNPENMSEEDLQSHPIMEELNLYHDEISKLIEQKDSVQGSLEVMSS